MDPVMEADLLREHREVLAPIGEGHVEVGGLIAEPGEIVVVIRRVRHRQQAVGRGATEQSAMAALRDDLRRAITPAIGAMQAAQEAAHREIDRPEEYLRLGRVCPDDQKALGERLRDR